MMKLLKLLRTFFLRWIKMLPPRVGGPLLWGWIYGAPQFPRWGVGTWFREREEFYSTVIFPPRGGTKQRNSTTPGGNPDDTKFV